MNVQIPLPPTAVARPVAPKPKQSRSRAVAPDLSYKRLAIVNVVFYGSPGPSSDWVLIDAGLAGGAAAIKAGARERFGDRPPVAIVLTHGHFDHVGAVKELAEFWDVPVYASKEEAPYLNGTASYPPPDPACGGGLMPSLSPLFPRSPIDLGSRLRLLAADGQVPGMPDWRAVATPGHSPGHVSLWRERDRALIVGDAFVTTRQESVFSVLAQKPEMHGPPRYFTPDWVSARTSVQRLAALDPELVITGHGQAMCGPLMREALKRLSDQFEGIALPPHLRAAKATV